MSALALARMLVPLVIVGTALGLAALFLRSGFPGAWRRWIRGGVLVAFVVALAGFVGWEVLRLLQPRSFVAALSLAVTSMVFVSAVGLGLTSLVWGPIAVWTRPRPAADAGAQVDAGRRAFLRRASGVLPAAAAASGPIGTAAAVRRPVITELSIHSPGVPAALDGLLLLHLTDLHLGPFIDERQVAAVVAAVRDRGARPDLVVLTGDIADDVTKLPGALAHLRALQAPLGIAATIGNHEIYRGRRKAEAAYDEARVLFLCDGGVALEKNGVRFWLAGADDPARGLDGPDAFLRRTVDRAFAACPDDVTCRILLSHRPRAFVHALKHRATLTLAGHTHGAQMAFLGRSLLAPLLPDSFLLGHYRRRFPDDEDGESHLYTGAGTGHWLPFRLNCPCEATLVTLRTRGGAARS